jgi:hypothetical protein
VTPASHGRRLASQSARYCESFVRHHAGSQPPIRCKEEHRAAARKNTVSRQLASRYDKIFARQLTARPASEKRSFLGLL